MQRQESLRGDSLDNLGADNVALPHDGAVRPEVGAVGTPIGGPLGGPLGSPLGAPVGPIALPDFPAGGKGADL